MVTVSDYAGLKPAWCPGCGNFGILEALNRALIEMGIEPRHVLLVSGIGQAGKLPHYTRGNVFNSLHGRPIPPAVGAKIANSELTVVAVSGDGDAYGEGGNHFLHAARRNHDITYLVHDNQVYGLTKGQASPTSDVGFVTKTTPYGAANPVNPIALAIVSGASFVGRGFAGDVEHLANLIKKGIAHRGFALIDILQPCISFNHRNTFQWYKERVYKLEDERYDPGDKKAALERALEWGDRIPIGVIYQVKSLTYEEQLPPLSKGPLVNQAVEPARVGKVLAEFM
ncbi:MAG: 2-oxoacid:ferredoxin oxidoreductase subunit beta [Dehalococcoidia bacterium]|nr:2-oxoacid:ferredoxin oxidoreductase subunit beta [Dehalococcoidia bacterium]MDH4299438.1 2-oxoacid:ferredoxin oxidoreductase subunit beta [Dehalococcoidia bacterium]MDH4366619.1 2-oxoacid:ferredoxin oxidoreductase subunit beta [Dehalococcoidia bacterium]